MLFSPMRGNAPLRVLPLDRRARQAASVPAKLTQFNEGTRILKRALFISFLSVLAQVAQASDALTFFNNWFVTGDYAVAGVGLRGTGKSGMASGNISMSGIPS